MGILVSGAVRAKARLVGADEWLAGLPELVGRLEREWSITVGRAYADATEAYVAEAVLEDGTPAVVKLLIPRAAGGVAYEIKVLRLASGLGCVALLREDSSQGALLLERLGPALVDAGLPLAERLEILTVAAQSMWRRGGIAAAGVSAVGGTAAGVSAVGGTAAGVSAVGGIGVGGAVAGGFGLPTGAEKGRRLIADVGRQRDRIDGRTYAYAIECARRRVAAYEDSRAVLVHGDVHQWNVLRAGVGWKLVDPDGLFAEPECDLGVLMREDPVELMAGDPWARAYWLAERTGTDPVAIWEWGVIERVSTGLQLDAIGMPVGADMLRAAAEIARQAS